MGKEALLDDGPEDTIGAPHEDKQEGALNVDVKDLCDQDLANDHAEENDGEDV